MLIEGKSPVPSSARGPAPGGSLGRARSGARGKARPGMAALGREEDMKAKENTVHIGNWIGLPRHLGTTESHFPQNHMWVEMWVDVVGTCGHPNIFG